MKSEMKRLVDDFAKHTVARYEAETADDTNRHVDASLAAFDELVTRFGDEGREALASLFQNDDPRIRSASAALLLRYQHEESMAVLKELTKERGLVALEAKQCMKNWETGLWELDPEPDASSK